MAWIKRNLYFVITLAVGIILIGGAGYFVYTAIGANSEAQTNYASALSDLTTLQQKKPFRDDDNIKLAKEDSQRVAQLAKEMGNAFVNFPPPPQVDPQEFIACLNSNLIFFRTEATNANVQLVAPDYTFSFSAEASTLSFPGGTSFGPWLQQLEEISAIVDILCAAKINSLDALQRAPVAGEDPAGADYVQSAISSNQVAVISPYKISFRGFSEEIANVLKGFAESPHCFLIKDLQVSPSKNVPMGATPQAQGPMYIQVQRQGFGGPRRGPGRRGEGGPGGYAPPQMETETIMVAAPTQPAGPVTILKPLPLFVTMTVDVVMPKNTQR